MKERALDQMVPGNGRDLVEETDLKGRSQELEDFRITQAPRETILRSEMLKDCPMQEGL